MDTNEQITIEECLKFAKFYRMWYGSPKVGTDVYFAFKYWHKEKPELKEEHKV